MAKANAPASRLLLAKNIQIQPIKLSLRVKIKRLTVTPAAMRA